MKTGHSFKWTLNLGRPFFTGLFLMIIGISVIIATAQAGAKSRATSNNSQNKKSYKSASKKKSKKYLKAKRRRARLKNQRALKGTRSRSRLALNSAKPNSSKLSSERFTWNNSFAVKGHALSDQFQEEVGAGIGIQSKLEYKFLESLKFKGYIYGSYSNVRQQYRYSDSANASGIRIRQAKAQVNPGDFMELGGGVIYQNEKVQSPFLAHRRGFPGAYAQAHYNLGANHIYLRGEHTVPTSTSFDSDRQDKEKMPSLTRVMLGGEYNYRRQFKIAPYVFTYNWQNLPAVTAQESARLGNTVRDQSAALFEYEYDYVGYGVGTALEFNFFYNAGLVFKYQTLQNSEAPSAFNKAEIAGLELKCQYRGVEYIPGFGVFYNESDTAPAVYASSVFGNNNRQGNMASFKVDFKRLGFNILVEHIDAKVINPNAYQTDQTWTFLRVETDYEIL